MSNQQASINLEDPLVNKWKPFAGDPVVAVLITRYQERRKRADESPASENLSALQDEISAITLQIESEIRSKKESKKSAWTTTFQVVLTAFSTLAALLGALQVNKSVLLNQASARPLFTITANVDPSGTVGGLPPTQVDVPLLNAPLPLTIRSTLPRVVVEFKNVGTTPAMNFKSQLFVIEREGNKLRVGGGNNMSTANPIAKDQVFSWIEDNLLLQGANADNMLIIEISYDDPISGTSYEQQTFYSVTNVGNTPKLFHATIEQADRAMKILKATRPAGKKTA